MKEKTIDGWLVFNWKEGSHRTRQSEPDDLGTYEITTPLRITVEIPDVDVPELAAKVRVPVPRVQTAALASLDDEDFPDWSDVAEEYLETYAEQFQAATDLSEVDDLVDKLTTNVLLDFDGLAEAKNVHDFLEDHAHRLHKDAREARERGDL